jgi:hypothetical protein
LIRCRFDLRFLENGGNCPGFKFEGVNVDVAVVQLKLLPNPEVVEQLLLPLQKPEHIHKLSFAETGDFPDDEAK